MRVGLLGTGSADGLPNPWCECGTCADQRPRGRRSPTSALVDGRLLLDCGPEAPGQAARLGWDLAGVETVAIGHAHHDHFDPSFLQYRSWVTDRPLRVVGPRPVLAQIADWLKPGQTAVTLVEVTAGDVIDAGQYRLTALPANHDAFGEAVLYLVEDGTSRLLYATDTGPLPSAVPAALAGSRLDAILLEQTFGPVATMGDHHLHLASFADVLATLRAVGTIDQATRVVAVHLSHHNPPLAELTAALADVGAEVHPDGAVLGI